LHAKVDDEARLPHRIDGALVDRGTRDQAEAILA